MDGKNEDEEPTEPIRAKEIRNSDLSRALVLSRVETLRSMIRSGTITRTVETSLVSLQVTSKPATNLYKYLHPEIETRPGSTPSLTDTQVGKA